MPSKRKSDVAMKAIKRPQRLKAKKCPKESRTDKTSKCQTVVKHLDGPIRTILKGLPNDQLKYFKAEVSLPTSEQKANIVDNKILFGGQSKDIPKTQNVKLIVCTSEKKDLDQNKVEPALQKIQIVRDRNNKIIVSGLYPNQRLIKLPNGKFNVLNMTPVPVTNCTEPILQPDQKPNMTPEPLTESQLLDAMSYLIRKDTGFVKKLHEAYLKSFADRTL